MIPTSLDIAEQFVSAYLGGLGISGWVTLDRLERNLAVGLLKDGTPEGQRARLLLARIRTRLSGIGEIAKTRTALDRATAEYCIAIERLRQTGEPEDWERVALRKFEIEMLTRRLKDARYRASEQAKADLHGAGVPISR